MLSEVLSRENIFQFSHGHWLLLPFTDNRATGATFDINSPSVDLWEVKIVKPGGERLVKTTDDDAIYFPDNTLPQIAIPIDPLDLDRQGMYRYEVTKLQDADTPRAVFGIDGFTVKAALPLGDGTGAPSSPIEGYYAVYGPQGELIATPGVGVGMTNPAFLGEVSIQGVQQPRWFGAVGIDGNAGANTLLGSVGSGKNMSSLRILMRMSSGSKGSAPVVSVGWGASLNELISSFDLTVVHNGERYYVWAAQFENTACNSIQGPKDIYLKFNTAGSGGLHYMQVLIEALVQAG